MMKNNRNIVECCNDTQQGSPHFGKRALVLWTSVTLVTLLVRTCYSGYVADIIILLLLYILLLLLLTMIMIKLLQDHLTMSDVT